MSDDSFEFSDDDELSALISNQSTANGPNHPNSHKVDYNNLSHYLYPSNMEERKYQRAIIATALLDNTLVALPTGLGKTFIAATIMLNFNRWFPDLKMVFMAPTRPLVAQQIKACAAITGIAASEMAILIEKPKTQRQSLWDQHRIFFTTPQVVDNDLRNGVVDAATISLLVMDEAHRAKGNYAYNNVAKHMARVNAAHRVLALTATPAATMDGVQELVDNLRVLKLEVRTDNLDDIVPYLKKKPIVRRRINPLTDISTLINLLAGAAQPIIDQATARKLIEVFNPIYLLKMAILEAQKKLQMDHSLGPQRFSAAPLLKVLAMVADGLRRLKIYGIKNFWPWFSEKYNELKRSKGKANRAFWDHENIEKVIEIAKGVAEDTSAPGHPKTTATIDELEVFFSEADDLLRVIVFTELRALALELVEAIGNRPEIGAKPHIFIGQAGGKNDEDHKKPDQFESGLDSSKHAHAKGMSQNVQKQVIADFKQGKYNVLIATSIGEEGLDIGEVDLIICYDHTALPIKNIQRMGRTGRKREGKVVLLFSGNEEKKFDQALAAYNQVQSQLQLRPELVSLHQLVRLVPPGYNPLYKKTFIDVPGENLAIVNEDDDEEILRIANLYFKPGKVRKKAREKKEPKKFFYPKEATGFTSVTDMLQRKHAKAVANEAPQNAPVDVFEVSDDDLPVYATVEDTPLGHLSLSLSSERQSKRAKLGSAPSANPIAKKYDNDMELELDDDVFNDGLDDLLRSR